MTQVLLPITSIRTDGGTQPRAMRNLNWVEEYAQEMARGAAFPPVTVFYDGSSYWLADGFHRREAAETLGIAEIPSEVRQGTQRDAILYSVGANAQHGYRRTNEDKIRAVKKLLDDPEWSRLSDNEIARRCFVTQPFVSSLRPRQASYNNYKMQEQNTRTVQRGGTTYQMKVGSQGRPTSSSSQSARVPPPTSIPRSQNAQPVSLRPEPKLDIAAASLREKAMDAIIAIAELPDPKSVIEAWMSYDGYGEPVEKIERAAHWLQSFLVLYRDAEPRRWSRVERMVNNVRTTRYGT